jgi:hypothetical protein
MDEIPLLQNSNELIIDANLPVDSPFFSLEERILKLYSVEQLEIALEDLQFQIAYKICGHVSLGSKNEVVVCTNAAGSSTKHQGVGRCHSHDKAIYRPRSPYTAHLKSFSSLQEVFEQFQNREKKLNDISDEMGIARTALSYQLGLLKEKRDGYNNEIFKNIILCLEMVRKIAESIAKIQQAESSGITLQSVTSFLYQVSEILNQEIVSKDVLTRILDRVSTECSFLQV